MKISKLATFTLVAVLFPTLTFAQQDSIAANPAQHQPMSIEQFDQEMAKAEENQKKMQEQMSLIQKAADLGQRQKLMQEHQVTMKQGMQILNDMWGRGKMGCCIGNMMGSHMMGWGQMGRHYSKMSPEQMRQHQYMMDRYMGMQQMMMDQLMQHQEQMGAQPR